MHACNEAKRLSRPEASIEYRSVLCSIRCGATACFKGGPKQGFAILHANEADANNAANVLCNM